jgi:hypothetical protein
MCKTWYRKKKKMPQHRGDQAKKLKLPQQTKHLSLSIKAISSLHVLPLGDGIFKKEIANRVYTAKA